MRTVFTSTNCSVGKRISWLSCAFSIIMFNRQSVWIIAAAFSMVLTAKSSPSTTMAEPTNQVASSVNRNNKLFYKKQIDEKWWLFLPSEKAGASIWRMIFAIKTSIKPTMLISKIDIIGSMLISNKSTRIFSAKCRTISGTQHSFANRFA